jgi:hypothetical protein
MLGYAIVRRYSRAYTQNRDIPERKRERKNNNNNYQIEYVGKSKTGMILIETI